MNVSANTPATINTIANPAAVAPAPGDPLTPLERVAVSIASETAATQQQSLAPLFANLNAVATTSSLPPVLQQAVVQVLAQQTPLAPDLNGDDIQTAAQTSGLFLESSLATGLLPPTGIPDLKAALIVLRQTLAAAMQTTETPQAVMPVVSNAVASGTRPATPSPSSFRRSRSKRNRKRTYPSADRSRRCAYHFPPSYPIQRATNQAVVAEALLGAGAEVGDLRRGAQPSAGSVAITAARIEPARDGDHHLARRTKRGSDRPHQHATTAVPRRAALGATGRRSLDCADAPLATTVRHLLDDTDAAIARQTLLQVASLPDRPDASGSRIDPAIPRWNFEIPFATPQGTAMAQFEISRDGGGNEVEAAKRVWRARFSLDVEPAGPVHALISLIGDRTSVRMWAERPQTASLLRAGASDLSQALSQAELAPGDIVIREGTPPQPHPAKAGHFLDRAL